MLVLVAQTIWSWNGLGKIRFFFCARTRLKLKTLAGLLITAGGIKPRGQVQWQLEATYFALCGWTTNRWILFLGVYPPEQRLFPSVPESCLTTVQGWCTDYSTWEWSFRSSQAPNCSTQHHFDVSTAALCASQIQLNRFGNIFSASCVGLTCATWSSYANCWLRS